MTGAEYIVASMAALAAYELPIAEHARALAAGTACDELCDALADGFDADVWDEGQQSAHDRAYEAFGLTTSALNIPDGALPWARETWVERYRDALPGAFEKARKKYEADNYEPSDRELSQFYGGDGPTTIQEQQQAAQKLGR